MINMETRSCLEGSSISLLEQNPANNTVVCATPSVHSPGRLGSGSADMDPRPMIKEQLEPRWCLLTTPRSSKASSVCISGSSFYHCFYHARLVCNLDPCTAVSGMTSPEDICPLDGKSFDTTVQYWGHLKDCHPKEVNCCPHPGCCFATLDMEVMTRQCVL